MSDVSVLFVLVPPRLRSGGERGRDDLLRIGHDRGLPGLPPGEHSAPSATFQSRCLEGVHCLQGVCVLSCSVMSDTATLWTVAHQTPLSREFSRQEYWSGLPFLPNPGIKSGSPALQADSLLSEPPRTLNF